MIILSSAILEYGPAFTGFDISKFFESKLPSPEPSSQRAVIIPEAPKSISQQSG